jgi:hypothetical protein
VQQAFVFEKKIPFKFCLRACDYPLVCFSKVVVLATSFNRVLEFDCLFACLARNSVDAGQRRRRKQEAGDIFS